MENWQKGRIAEHKVVVRAIEKGLIISKPLVDTVPYDFIIDDGDKFVKVQVKWADGTSGSEGSVSARLTTRSNNKTKQYKKGDFDLLLVYIPKIDSICAFGPEHFENKKSALAIRLEPTKNGQAKNCLIAELFKW
jgi:hypothetical protein